MTKVIEPTQYFHPSIYLQRVEHYHWHFLDGRVRCNEEDKGSKNGPGEGKARSRS